MTLFLKILKKYVFELYNNFIVLKFGKINVKNLNYTSSRFRMKCKT